MIELIIQHGEQIFEPVLKDNITIKSSRKGEPSVLNFTLIADGIVKYEEGDPVRVRVNGENAFYGFIFKISGDKSEERQITAYDQRRYLKNKGSYNIEKLRADQVIKNIAEDVGLQVGTLINTGYLYSNVEDNVSYFDIILNAMDETTRNTEKLYVLYDDMGKLCLDDIGNRKLDILLDSSTGENYEFTSSIDGETYNSVTLYKDSDSQNNKSINVSDQANIDKWGLLRYYASYSDGTDGDTLANALLELYNQKERTLTLSKQLGDIRVMGGTLVAVSMDLGDTKISSYMMVEEVTHEISENYHTMTLNLTGGALTQ